MIICNNNSIDIIQGVIGYGNAEGITDWRITNTNNGVFNILNSSSIIRPSGGTSEIGEIPGTADRYMIFTAGTSTFTVPSGGIVCDILIVGGGGGGGNAIYNSSHEPGGGGAGGVVYMVNKTLSAGTYKINVGEGGAGDTNGNNSTITDNNNNNITLDNILLIGKGGGKGATGYQTVGGDGGSGGGGGHNRANGGTSTQGNTFWNGTTYIAGGNNGARPGGGSSGGGGGGAGEAGDADGGGCGGDGIQVNITGTNTFYAGGGNAYYNTSTIRSDGGGGTLNGTGSQQNGGSALPNTGSGGSGAYTISSSTTGGNGGSGIVIIRYFTTNLSIIENGNVGIGTIPITSSSKLEIIGDINATSYYNSIGKSFLTDTNNYVLLTSNILVTRILTELNSSRAQWTNVSTGIYYNTSNVGIGTTNPISKLHLYNNTISETKLTIQNNINNYIGNIITGSTDKYIIFSETSSFIISSDNANCDILMIGGGGGGSLGGGGAGACIVAINQTLMTGTYTVIVGTGGTGAAYATAGNDSSISFGSSIKYLAKGGGPGGYNFQVVNGGCGGGGGYNPSNHVGGNPLDTNIVNGVSGIGPSVTSTYAVFGTKGGTATNNGTSTMAGGGGIGMDGGNYTGPSLLAGVGGDGLFQATINSQIYNFRSYFANNTTLGVQDGTTGNYFIGGGGGGSCYFEVGSTPGNGGKGGGGKGGDVKTLLTAISGTENTGSGGGGNDSQGVRPYANGGSGIVIIRYRTATSTITIERCNSSIELIRGSINDSNRDYKIGNYNGDFIVKSSLSGTDTNYIKITGSTGAITNPTGTTSWTSASDRRIKENIERASYDKCYESINKLELNRFNYINGFNTVNRDITQLGFIAQEVKEIFPKSVFENSYINNNINISDLHSIDITQINYTLYGAVKKLIEKVNNNVKKIEKIENILNIDNILTNNITSNLIMN